MPKSVRFPLLGALCALMLLAAAPASHAATAPFTKKVAVTGTKGFEGTYTISKFVRRNGKLYSVGTLRGTMHGKKVRRTGVRMPAKIANAAGASQIPPTGGACQILN